MHMTMSKLSIINHKSSIIIILMIMCSSCNFLERQPYDSVDTTNGFQTAADAEAAVNACYQPLQWAKLYNMRIWTLDIIANESEVGAGGGTDGLETTEMANFIATADNFAALDLWRGPSPGILRCNFVLKNVPGMQLDNDLKNRLLGEAYFLRAHYYFILVRLFGGVPMPTEPLTSDSPLKMPRASVDEVYSLIMEDLNQAGMRMHKLTLLNRKTCSVNGVNDVLSFDTHEILLETEQGMMMFKGEELHVNRLSLDKGEVDIDGRIDSILYSDVIRTPEKSGSLLSRLFR